MRHDVTASSFTCKVHQRSRNISRSQSNSSVKSLLLGLTNKDIALWAEVANIHSA